MTNQLQAMPEKSDVRKQIEAGLEAFEVLQWADDHDLANAQWNAATPAFNIKKLLAEHDRAIKSLRVELEAADVIEHLVKEHDTPPQRQWVGLTEWEREAIAVECGAMSADWLVFMEAVERALKEKNT